VIERKYRVLKSIFIIPAVAMIAFFVSGCDIGSQGGGGSTTGTQLPAGTLASINIVPGLIDEHGKKMSGAVVLDKDGNVLKAGKPAQDRKLLVQYNVKIFSGSCYVEVCRRGGCKSYKLPDEECPTDTP